MSANEAFPEPKRLVYAAGALSIFAALVHGAVTEEHLAEWWLYGVAFILMGISQGLYGLALVLLPSWQPGAGGPAELGLAERQRFYVAGVLGNAAIIALYVLSRTVGVPLGPSAGEAEPVTGISLFSKALEVALVACLLALLRAASRGSEPSESSRPRAAQP